jgi:hypothetical protein
MNPCVSASRWVRFASKIAARALRQTSEQRVSRSSRLRAVAEAVGAEVVAIVAGPPFSNVFMIIS